MIVYDRISTHNIILSGEYAQSNGSKFDIMYVRESFGSFHPGELRGCHFGLIARDYIKEVFRNCVPNILLIPSGQFLLRKNILYHYK